MEPNASGTAKSKTQFRKIQWEKLAWTAAISIGTGLLSGAAMAAGSAVVGALAGSAAAETAATAGTVVALARKAL